MRFKIAILAAAVCAFSVSAEIPDGYYSSCTGKSKGALKSQLYTIVKDHTPIPYGNGMDQTWGAYFKTDVHPGGYWWDMYTTNEVPVVEGEAPDNNVMNKEHSFPKSWWGGNNNDAYKDLMHLYPVNSVANSTRNNWPYGEVAVPKKISNKCTNPRFKHGTPVSGQGGGSETVFEPDDEFKGDLARTYFYMVTCYQNLTWQDKGTYTAAQGTYPTLQPWAIDMLLRWHREDPVSDKELNRNEAVYEIQGNRNPFIDHPEMAEYIWGDKMDEAWNGSGSEPDPDPDKATLTSPVTGDWYHFTGVHPSETLVMEIPVLGAGFTRNLTARIGGEKASLFSIMVGGTPLEAVSISAADVTSADGYVLKVRYAPAAATPADAFDFATLTLSGADLVEPVEVNLQGFCTEAVTLPPVVTLPPEDVTDTGYTMRWMPLAMTVDGYTVTRKVYDGEVLRDTFSYEVDGESTSLAITDRDPSLREAVSVTATLDGVESPAGNEIIIEAYAALGSIEAAGSEEIRFFDVNGTELPGRPDAPGVYVARTATSTAKTVIIK